VKRIAMALALAGIPVLPVTAADCTLERATYAEPGGWTIAFRPVLPEEALGVSNAFALVLPGDALRLDGLVTWGNGFTRPIGALTFNCPAEATYEQTEACTHWKGIVYGVTAGKIGLLGGGDGPAHDEIVLANLGQVLNYSLFPSEAGARQVTITGMPWDVFTFTGCAP
jgi:hypothetical protein